MADDCPYCRILADRMRSTADDLSSFAGGIIGGRIGGTRGRLIGQEIAPKIIETTALKIRDKVKAKRTKGQKTRQKKMSAAMKKANSMGRLKNGKYRKGWDSKRIMRTAHRMCK